MPTADFDFAVKNRVFPVWPRLLIPTMSFCHLQSFLYHNISVPVGYIPIHTDDYFSLLLSSIMTWYNIDWYRIILGLIVFMINNGYSCCWHSLLFQWLTSFWSHHLPNITPPWCPQVDETFPEARTSMDKDGAVSAGDVLSWQWNIWELQVSMLMAQRPSSRLQMIGQHRWWLLAMGQY